MANQGRETSNHQMEHPERPSQDGNQLFAANTNGENPKTNTYRQIPRRMLKGVKLRGMHHSGGNT